MRRVSMIMPAALVLSPAVVPWHQHLRDRAERGQRR